MSHPAPTRLRVLQVVARRPDGTHFLMFDKLEGDVTAREALFSPSGDEWVVVALAFVSGKTNDAVISVTIKPRNPAQLLHPGDLLASRAAIERSP